MTAPLIELCSCQQLHCQYTRLQGMLHNKSTHFLTYCRNKEKKLFLISFVCVCVCVSFGFKEVNFDFLLLSTREQLYTQMHVCTLRWLDNTTAQCHCSPQDWWWKHKWSTMNAICELHHSAVEPELLHGSCSIESRGNGRRWQWHVWSSGVFSITAVIPACCSYLHIIVSKPASATHTHVT